MTTTTTPRERALSVDARVARIMRTRGVDRETAIDLMNRELDHLRAKGHVPFVASASVPKPLQDALENPDAEDMHGLALTGVVRPRSIPRRGTTITEMDELRNDLEWSYRDEDYARHRRRIKVLLTVAILVVAAAAAYTLAGIYGVTF